MSLGIRSPWRARPYVVGIVGPSLIPREAPRWHLRASSTAAAKSSPNEMQAEKPGRILLDSLADVPLRPHAANESVLVTPFCRYPHKGETARSRRRHHQSAVRQARLEAMRHVQMRRLPDWRVILGNLTSWTNQRTTDWHRDAMKILLPRDAVHSLLNGADENIWAIRSRTGCKLKLHDDGGDERPWLLLSGAESAINRAAEEILQIAEGATIVRDGGGPDGVGAPLLWRGFMWLRARAT